MLCRVDDAGGCGEESKGDQRNVYCWSNGKTSRKGRIKRRSEPEISVLPSSVLPSSSIVFGDVCESESVGVFPQQFFLSQLDRESRKRCRTVLCKLRNVRQARAIAFARKINEEGTLVAVLCEHEVPTEPESDICEVSKGAYKQVDLSFKYTGENSSPQQ